MKGLQDLVGLEILSPVQIKVDDDEGDDQIQEEVQGFNQYST